MSKRPPTPAEGARSRCGPCGEMVLEGTAHDCRMGNDSKKWVNPMADNAGYDWERGTWD